MEITVVKGRGNHRAFVTTPAGVQQFGIADYGTALPHELVHYAVERALSIKFGFWGLLANGADLATVARFNARSPRSVRPPTDPLVTEHRDELINAEHLVAALYQLGVGESTGHGLDPAQAASIRKEIDVLNDQWQTLPVGGSIELTWN